MDNIQGRQTKAKKLAAAANLSPVQANCQRTQIERQLRVMDNLNYPCGGVGRNRRSVSNSFGSHRLFHWPGSGIYGDPRAKGHYIESRTWQGPQPLPLPVPHPHPSPSSWTLTSAKVKQSYGRLDDSFCSQLLDLSIERPDWPGLLN